MGKFHDLVNQIKEPGDDGIPDTIYDDLTVEYDTLLGGSTETVSKKDEEISRLNGEVSRLKSANYDLLTKVSTGTEPIELDDGLDDEDEVTVDSLFIKRK